MRDVFDIKGLHTGRSAPFGPHGEMSAIRKSSVEHAMLGTMGFEGDEQADLAVYGGIDKAVNVYSLDRYVWWSETLGLLIPVSAPRRRLERA